MARDPKVTRKAYEYKLGKDLASKLDDKQIHLLSEYYNSLSDKETSEIDSQIVQGRNNTELHEMAIGMVEENESRKTPPKPKAKPKPKVKPKPKAQPIEEASNFIPATEEDKEKYSVTPEEAERRHKAFVDAQNKSKKPDKKAVTALVKKFSADKKDTKQPTNENIDPEVLNMLGLDDISDFDYDDYKTLLKEKMLANQMVGGRGDNDLLKNEFKRVKSKTGRFKPKKKTVNVSKVVQSGKKYNKSAVNTQKLLSGSKEAESTKTQVKGNAVADSFASIGLTLLGIDSLLKGLLGEEKKESEQDAKNARKSAQKAEEEKSEKAAKTKATKSLKGFKAPKMGFLDMIKNFFKNILLGGFIMKALDWFQNEENQKKIQNVITFITDNLDKILVGIAALVGLNIGMKILGFLKLFSPLVSGLILVVKGLMGVLFSPAGLIALLVAGIFAATAALKDPIEDLIRDNFKKTYGEEYADEGAFITKLGDQYGRIASEKDRERLLSDDEKQSAFYIDQYDSALKERKRLSDQIERDEKTLANSKDRRSKNAAGKRLQKNKSALSQTELKITTLKEQIDIGGKSLEQLQKEFTEGLILPQTGLSKELYPTAGTGAEMSGVPKHFGKGESNIPEVTPQTPMIAPTGAYDVIIPLDHAKKAGTVADDASGTTFNQSRATGADGREREHQDSAAAKLKLKLEEKGLKVKIVTPEEYGNYEDYDKFIKGQANKGVRIVPLHFDAIRSAGGVGFLTRTRAGDDQDAAFAAPITDALAKFQKENPELGNMSSDTQVNATVNAGAASPTALVELGVLKDWEDKYGKNFTGTSKFDELIQGVADGIFKGGGFSTPPGMQEVKPGHSRPEPPAPPNTDQASAVLPLGGGGSGGDEIASASGGRASAALFSSIDGNNPNPTQVGAIFNLTAVG